MSIRPTAPIRNGSSSFYFCQYRFDLPLEIFEAAVVFDHIVCESAFFRQAHLGVNMLLRFVAVETVPLLQAPKLGVDVASDQNHRPKPFVQVALEQQWNFINYDSVAGGSVLADTLFGESADARVNDRFEFSARVGIVEDNRSEFLAVKSLVGLQNFDAESRDDFTPGVAARLDDLTCQRVSIYDCDAETLKDFCDGAFP